MRTTLPQGYCPDVTDHPGPHSFKRHIHFTSYWFRCPGRHTPSLHRMPGAEPTQPSDPFAGIDENTEADASRPAVS